MRWIALFLACLIALPASAQSWATRDLCLSDRAVFHDSVFADGDLERIDAIARSIPNGTGRFWELTAPSGAVSHLWGTMHSTNPIILNLPQQVEETIKASRVIAPELDFTQDTRLQIFHRNNYIQPSPFLRAPRLDPHDLGLPLEVYDWIATRLAGLGWGHDGLSKLTAGAVAELLLQDPCDDFASWVYPIQDGRIQMLGAISGADILGLEDPRAFRRHLDKEENAELADAMIATYAAYLNPDRTREAVETSHALYLQGQLGRMMGWDRLYMDGLYPDGQGLDWAMQTDAYLLDERNHNFLDRALPELGKGGVFIAIGAFHLPGEQGMVALLRRAGFTVERIPLPGEVP